MNNKIFLTVIVPAYNEAGNISRTLCEIASYIKDRNITHEVIIVDDGSIDNTGELARASQPLFMNFSILKNDRNRGKGYSVKKAMLLAQGQYALFMDADNSTSIYEFDKFLPYLREGYDAVIASRRLKDSTVEKPQPLLRAKMGELYILLARFILKLNISDFNCGFKVFKTESTRFVFNLQKMEDWSFDAEDLFLMNKYGLKVQEVPIRWVHKGGSKVRPFRDAVASFFSVVKIMLNNLRHLYETK